MAPVYRFFFSLLLLLQVGFAIGSNHKHADRSAAQGDIKDQIKSQPHIHGGAPQPHLLLRGALRGSPKDATLQAQEIEEHEKIVERLPRVEIEEHLPQKILEEHLHLPQVKIEEHLHLPQKILEEHILEEHLPRVVTAFLHTGDSSTLKHANCSRRYELTSLRNRRSHATPPHPSLNSVLDTVLHATNFLNMILQANRSREQSLRRDIEWYHALVRSILEGDGKIHRAVVTFNTEPSATEPSVLLQATRAHGGEIVLQDLSSAAHYHLKNRTVETLWYHEVKDKKKQHLNFHRTVLSQDFRSIDNSLRRGESFIPDRTHLRWSAPYLECENGNFNPRWLLTLSAGFYGLKENLEPDFRGVVRVDINLQSVDIDQCSADGWFAGTHRCNLTTMECLPIRGHGFVLDKYKCHCKKGFYHPNRVAVNGFTRMGRKGKAADSGPNADEGSSNDCLPCQEGCAFCKDDTPCVVRDDNALRMVVLSSQCLCMLLLFISMVVIYHFRRNKGIRASGLVLLEAILCGALLLYFPVVILYFQPSVFRCILLRWVRLLGFATVYGTVTLKLYRVLKVFLSRTAQRIPYMTSWHVLRLLVIILLIVVWFLVAWTSAVCQNADRKLALIDVGYTPDGLQFSMCLLDRWDYMMAVAEFLFLLWTVYLCYAVRTVPSAFHEPRYMTIAVHNELILSAIFYVIRFTLAPELHPDWMLLLFFAHTHLTITVTLGLLLVPKILFSGTHMRDDIASEAYEDELDMGRSGSYLNSSITSAWSEHSLDPEDIREELKKLYSQLEIYKRKKMLANNPHLQKKRSSKKGLGRSLMRRITELPESVHRQCSREDKEAEHGGNRNSICVLRKNPFDPNHPAKPAKDETPVKNNVFSLKKSHSSYDHVRDQSEDSSSSATDKMEENAPEGSLLDTLMGKKLVKKSNEKTDATGDSTESVPLVCKSASAHNLTADKKPIHPRTSMLQKSLSVIASAKEKTLGLTGKAQGAEDSNNKRSQTNGKDTRLSGVEPEDECLPKMIISQSVEYKQTAAKSGIMKQQVSGSQPSICSEPVVKGKDTYDLSEVCPWEVEELPTPSENRVQKHVSIAPKETTTLHGNGTKATIPQQQQQKQKVPDQSPSSALHSKELQRTLEVCPWEDADDSQASHVEGLKTQPCVQANQNTKTAQSHPATESFKTQRVDVCPWDFEEPTSKATEFTPSPDATKQRKGISPVGGKGRSAVTEPSLTGVSHQPPVSKADVCPWDCDATAPPPHFERMPGPPPQSERTPGPPPHSERMPYPPPQSERTPYPPPQSERTPYPPPQSERTPGPSQASKPKESPSKKKGTTTPSTRTVEKDRPKDTDEVERSRTKAKDKNRSSEKPVSQQKMAQVCPWDVVEDQEMPLVEKRKSPHFGAAKVQQAGAAKVQQAGAAKVQQAGAAKVQPAEVCPWDFDAEADKRAADKSASVAKQQSNQSPKGPPVVVEARKADICPWDFDENTQGKKA